MPPDLAVTIGPELDWPGAALAPAVTTKIKTARHITDRTSLFTTPPLIKVFRCNYSSLPAIVKGKCCQEDNDRVMKVRLEGNVHEHEREP